MGFGLLDYAAMVAYIGGLVALGFYFMTRQASTDDYFLGGRGFHWLPVAISMFTSLFSAVMVRAGRASGIECVIRTGANSFDDFPRLLSMGTNGLMIPHVQTAEFARRAIERIKYPPLGHRELENVNADADFGLMPLEEYLRAANDETLVVVQIEDLEAAAQADAIAEVPGVDVLFVGPADLALSLGLPGECRHPKVLDVIRRVVRACEANGKVCGTPALEPDHCRLLIDEGVRYLTDSPDWRMLVTGFRARRDAYADLGFTFRPERSRG